MRTFVAITCWILWIVGVLITLMFLFHFLFNRMGQDIAVSPEKAVRFTKFCWTAIAVYTALSLGVLLARRRFWYKCGRPPGLGFWVVSLFLYGCIIFIPALGFAPFFSGDRSSLQGVSLIVGGIFLALTIPRLPGVQSSLPPPLNDNPRKPDLGR